MIFKRQTPNALNLTLVDFELQRFYNLKHACFEYSNFKSNYL